MTEFTSPGIQTYTIGTSGTYDITADGAQGGAYSSYSGGKGAEVSGDVYLQHGTKLEIVVGGMGGSQPYQGAGGGGGSFVIETYNGTTTVDTILAVAGGGGGAGASYTGGGANAYAPTGGSGGPTGGAGGTKGAAGGGGGGPTSGGGSGPHGYGGGGGGGFTGGNGGGSSPAVSAAAGAVVGSTFKGGAGGIDGGTSGVGGAGGVGGGGGGGTGGGGGGGGDGGGGGASGHGGGGGGGGSYLDTPVVTTVFQYSYSNSGNGSVTIDPSPICFLRGTRIRTVTGDKAVESLTMGEAVLTASGEARPIRWIGSRGLDCTRHPKPNFVWPIRIQAGAFGPDMPARDLWMSPFHSILLEGVLVQVEKLVNGATVVQVPRERVEYWHVELESHDILLAEGLPAESYLDVGNRTGFVNGGAYLEAYPDFKPKEGSETCVPVVKEGPVIERAKATLLARAKALGYALNDDPDLHLIADGRRIDPTRLSEKRLAFILPAAFSSIELRCRCFAPAQINPASDDVRSLGICVSRLQLDGVEVALEDEAVFASGWHPLECNPQRQSWRWSTECARLPAGTRLVVIEMCNQGPYYWAQPTMADESWLLRKISIN